MKTLVRFLSDQNVVFSATALVEDQTVTNLAGTHFGNGPAGTGAQKCQGLSSSEAQSAHMTKIKDAAGGPHRAVFVHDAVELDGHVPTVEVDHFSPKTGLQVIEASALIITHGKILSSCHYGTSIVQCSTSTHFKGACFA